MIKPDPAPEEEIMDFFKRATPPARQVLALAREQAERLRHEYISTAHLLLGLMRLRWGLAVEVLRDFGLNFETIWIAVEKLMEPGSKENRARRIYYAPEVKRILALADEERQALHHVYIGTEHILLGMLRESDGVAARVFQNLGVDPAIAREKLLLKMG